MCKQVAVELSSLHLSYYLPPFIHLSGNGREPVGVDWNRRGQSEAILMMSNTLFVPHGWARTWTISKDFDDYKSVPVAQNKQVATTKDS